MKKRPYALKKRAESKEDTRARIVAATAALHEELGPRATTISAVAEKAGVQRLTVYRHFPDEMALFSACTSHWLALNPPPQPQIWSSISDKRERCLTALQAMYAYYRRTERMWDVSHRDEPNVPALQGPMQAFRDYLAGLRETILESNGGTPGLTYARALLGHALRFQTWQSLAAEGLSDSDIAKLMSGWITATLEAGAHDLTSSRT
jgi:AcrR family transcriptional regulator